MKKYLSLFLAMLKVGLFTFGGGYAMLALLETEFVAKRKWIDGEEFLDMVALAESTPGPIAINAATYIGYRVGKTLGALLATLAVCIPSFVIIYVISLFFDRFLAVRWIAAAFRGIQVGVLVLIGSAGIRLLRTLPKNAFSFAVLFATFVCMVLFALFSVDFSAVFYILIAAALGVAIYGIGCAKRRAARKQETVEHAPDSASGNNDSAAPSDASGDTTDESDATAGPIEHAAGAVEHAPDSPHEGGNTANESDATADGEGRQ